MSILKFIMMLKIKVKPNSNISDIEDKTSFLLINLKNAPENNKANIELIKLLGKKFNVSHEKIKILKGKTSRNKIVEVKNEI